MHAYKGLNMLLLIIEYCTYLKDFVCEDQRRKVSYIHHIARTHICRTTYIAIYINVLYNTYYTCKQGGVSNSVSFGLCLIAYCTLDSCLILCIALTVINTCTYH